MSGEWKNKRETIPFNVFEELREIEKIMNEIAEQEDKKKSQLVRIYVFSNRQSPRDDTMSKRLINGDRQRHNSRVIEEKEALVDVFDRGEEVMVVAELPNAKKEDIELHGGAKSLTVFVNEPQRRNFTIAVPAKLNVKRATINYKNGVVEITLPKLKNSGDKSFSVFI